MNWHLSTEAKKLKDVELDVEHGDQDNDKAEPDDKVVAAAKKAAATIASALDSKDIHVEIHAHEATKGRGFRPGHVVLSVSNLDPNR